MRALAFAVLAGCAAPPRAAPAPEWEARFRQPGSPWRGGDAVYSVALSSDRILWLFGDSFIAPPGAAGREKSVMVRNSLALQKLPGDPEFHWRTVGGKPADAFASAVPGEWLWPLSGQRIGRTLFLFMSRLKAKGSGAFGFEATANVLLSVANPDDPPPDWVVKAAEVPFFDFGVTFGNASLAEGEHLFVYGHRKGSLVVARAPAGGVEDFALWRFHDGAGWAADVRSAKELFAGAATELSVSPAAGGFVAVYHAPFLSPQILARRAARPEGPWAPPEVLYRCPDADWKKTYFCYAAKAHPHFSGTPGELLVSYACNSTDFGDLFRDLRLYWPRFVRLRPGR